MSNYMKAAAVLFAFLVVIFFLLAPVVSPAQQGGYGSSQNDNLNGGVLMVLCGWPVLPAIFGVIMAMCALLLPGKTAAIINAVCAFVPLLTYFFVLGIDEFEYMVRLAKETGANLYAMGYGTILSMISGFICAALCFFSDNSPAKPRPAPGPGPSPTSEW